MACSAASTSMVKSSLRGPEIQPVPVPRAIRPCIEYEGSKPIAVRPGPPKVCSSCWMTSLEPLAAQTFAEADLVPAGAGEVARRARCAARPRPGRGSG